MRKWKELKWGDIAKLEYGKGLREYQNIYGKYPVYGTNGKIGTTNTFLSPYPGIIIGRKGAYRGVHYSEEPFYVIDTAFYLKPSITDLNIKFAYYHLLNVDINAMDSGSAIPSTSREEFYDLNILLPSLAEQSVIAEMLSSFDDKIDLLHRQNKTLEELAETLFRQWCVEEETHSYNEKGLDEIAEFLNGLACQKYPVKLGEVGLPVIKIKELRTGITESSDIATCEVPEKYIVKDGDMLFSWSGSLDVIIWSGGQGVLNQHLFKVTSNFYPQWFYYFWVKHHLPEFKGIAEDKATTMGHIQRHHLSNTLVLVPPKEIIENLNGMIIPTFDKIKVNQAQIHTLTNLRDSLLPKLMSGEVRVGHTLNH